MLLGEKITLRARIESDAAVLRDELLADVRTRSAGDSRPWTPARVTEPVGDLGDSAALFTVAEHGTGEVVGEALLWGIDSHNRLAHLGISLRPAFRGRGYGREVVELLCHYGFTVRGMQRLQVETLAENAAMIAAATGVGFVREGVLRRSSWVYGSFRDEVLLGLLAEEWQDPYAD
ncbi:GCN5 family acetyltransferase [Kitasatospora sp. MMS16-BH015]|uniref:GNAT family N-acetyltransferase n=1 Tax=Kitasatospora sp. MMS16-BH015 TaxID=2018025 RepID=UPI000CA0B2DD|nr:GNAT family protein [Kitasatospora sp. MMS16-BH015]AUG80582.1 GCN5 family acetyltransferase [Kitasatospora sp. MMS16-BH015]